ncbi:hypothetical protein NQZ68_028428 [Dissostichus eleginoides]|nr:hypothetical protein NQZ68_028428 [Dissostichus eleginoides]
MGNQSYVKRGYQASVFGKPSCDSRSGSVMAGVQQLSQWFLSNPGKERLVTRGDSTSPQNYHRTILAIHEAIKWDALPLDLKAAKDGVPVEALYLATSASLLVPQPSVAAAPTA